MSINNIYFFSGLAYRVHQFSLKINPRIEMARCYYKIFGKLPDFTNPKSLIEKIYWLQLNTDTSQWSYCADKYLVRSFLEKKGCGQYLNELYGRWDSPDEIDFCQLPNQFVLKTNNACDQTLIVEDKERIDEVELKKSLKWWMNHPFGASGGELHYLNIKPCVIAEKLLPKPEGESSLIDYKFWFFSGEPFCVFVTYGRTDKGFNFALYDLNWQPLSQFVRSTSHATFFPEKKIAKPDSFEEMLLLARKLAEGFPVVRVDLYEVDNRPIFGEMTFSTGFGYFTDDFYRILGDKVVLPIVN